MDYTLYECLANKAAVYVECFICFISYRLLANNIHGRENACVDNDFSQYIGMCNSHFGAAVFSFSWPPLPSSKAIINFYRSIGHLLYLTARELRISSAERAGAFFSSEAILGKYVNHVSTWSYKIVHYECHLNNTGYVTTGVLSWGSTALIFK